MLQQFTQLRLHFFLNPGHMWMYDLDGLVGRLAGWLADRPRAAALLWSAYLRGAVLVYRAWGMKEEEIYEEVNAKLRKAKLTL